MIIVSLHGPLYQQLAQFTFGSACAQGLHTQFKVDLGAPSLLGPLGLTAEQASAPEIAAARQHTVRETGPCFSPALLAQLRDGAYLDGSWNDYRYCEAALPGLSGAIVPDLAWSNGQREVLAAIDGKVAVSLDLRQCAARPGLLAPPPVYYQDAIADLRQRLPDAHFFVLCDQPEAVPAQYGLGQGATLIGPELIGSEAQALLLMAACRHHIVSWASTAEWAARLDPKQGGQVIAPQLAVDVHDPVWAAQASAPPICTSPAAAARRAACASWCGPTIRR